MLSQYDVGTIPVSLDRVTAGDAARLAHKRVKMLILLGADDGSIPAVAPSPGLLSDQDRETLAEQGLELAPRLADKLTREMTIVYTTCAVPSERLLVTWPRSGERPGEERRPSFLVERLCLLYPRMDRVEEGSLSGSFRLSAPGPALEQAGRDGWPPPRWSACPATPGVWSASNRRPTCAGGRCPAQRWRGCTARARPCRPPAWTPANPATFPTFCASA